MQDMNYFKDLLARLTGVSTVSSEDQTADRSNLELLKILENEAESMNGVCTRQNVISSPYKDNMLIRFGPDVPGGLLLSGHTDTVPYDEHGWNSDPFTLTEDRDLAVARHEGIFRPCTCRLQRNKRNGTYAKAALPAGNSKRGNDHGRSHKIFPAGFSKTGCCYYRRAHITDSNLQTQRLHGLPY